VQVSVVLQILPNQLIDQTSFGAGTGVRNGFLRLTEYTSPSTLNISDRSIASSLDIVPFSFKLVKIAPSRFAIKNKN
jgi:hypothetical protein